METRAAARAGLRRVALLGATITGNRGAESRLRAAVQRVAEFAPNVHFTAVMDPVGAARRRAKE